MPSIPPWLSRIGDWIFRVSAMRVARSRLAKPTPDHDRAFNQARLLLEVGRRVAEPVEALPKGARAAVLIGLYRDAAHWALVAAAGAPPDAANAPDRAAVWAAVPPDRLSGLGVDGASLGASLEATRALFLEHSPAKDLDATEEDVARLRGLAETLLWEMEAPKRTIEHVLIQRWSRVGALACLAVVAVFGLRIALRGQNLAAGRPFKTSTTLPECTAPNKCGDIFFCTLNQDNPWIDFDLGAAKAVHRVDVKNRSDCCAERAVPLVVEVSLDDKQWVQVARRDAEFADWTATFPKRQARYVRLRVPRLSLFHLDEVAIR